MGVFVVTRKETCDLVLCQTRHFIRVDRFGECTFIGDQGEVNLLKCCSCVLCGSVDWLSQASDTIGKIRSRTRSLTKKTKQKRVTFCGGWLPLLLEKSVRPETEIIGVPPQQSPVVEKSQGKSPSLFLTVVPRCSTSITTTACTGEK